MEITDKIASDLAEAQKAKDADKVGVLRMLNSALKNAEIDKRAKNPDSPDLTEDEVLDVIGREVKQRRDSVSEYEAGGRQDLADKEKAEIEVLSAYLPEQMSEEEIEALVRQAIEEIGATAPSDMGRVMGALMPKTKGKADGKVVSETVRRLLSRD